MKKFTLLNQTAITLALTTLAMPVWAVQMEGNYLSSAGGLGLQPNITYHATNNSDANGNRYLATENKPGTSFDLAYGFQTEDLRAEVSALYLENKIKKSLMRSTGFDIEGTPNMGSTKVIGLMANGMYDFNSETDFTPYIGFGVGFVRMNLNVKSFPAFTATTSTSGTTLVVNDPPVTTTTTSGNTTTETTTYTQTTKVTTIFTPGASSTSGVTPLPPTTTIVTTVSSPPASTAFSNTFAPPGVSTPFGPTPGPSYNNAPSHATDTRVQLAYQTIMGASYKLTDYFKVTADYRYLRALSTTFKMMNAGVADVPMKGTYTNHRLMLGLTAFLD